MLFHMSVTLCSLVASGTADSVGRRNAGKVNVPSLSTLVGSGELINEARPEKSFDSSDCCKTDHHDEKSTCTISGTDVVSTNELGTEGCTNPVTSSLDPNSKQSTTLATPVLWTGFWFSNAIGWSCWSNSTTKALFSNTANRLFSNGMSFNASCS
ncbi:hypothetical protein OGAPHI_003350 [Ogataea philodendri]|uniref:Secreted protein n=1 Tax=Ogataea philodendri TaxID=1378263 RepID=A0A9P8P7Z9_9ASCO|nr:uncharacterized protein OGAPHI_003350 [Ogataea philodendri]KAH3666900.1 hypothetical protein OGAPHI_003350 [Ogataea philodendri]